MGDQVPTNELETVKEWLSGMYAYKIAYHLYSLVEDMEFENTSTTEGRFSFMGVGRYLAIIAEHKEDR